MTASARFVMKIDPAVRGQWRTRAAASGVTTAEYVRRAVSFYDDEEVGRLAELECLMPEFNAAIELIRSDLIEARTVLAKSLDPHREVEARERALASITEDDVAAMAALIA